MQVNTSEIRTSTRILECHSRGDKRFSALYARVQALGNVSIETIYQLSKRDEYHKPYKEPKGKVPYFFTFDEKIYDGEFVADYYAFLWLCYFEENPRFLEYAKKFDGYRDIFDRERGFVYTRTTPYPRAGGPICQSAAIAAICADIRPSSTFYTVYERMYKNRMW